MALTLIRGVAWFGVVVVFWSMNVRWGSDVDAGIGPPGQWQRAVVGCGVLSLIAAIALSVSGRRGKLPSWTARGIALGATLLIFFIAYMLRRSALSGFAHLIEGPGWLWLVSGGGFTLAAITGTMAIQPESVRRQAEAAAKPGAADKRKDGMRKSKKRKPKKRR